MLPRANSEEFGELEKLLRQAKKLTLEDVNQRLTLLEKQFDQQKDSQTIIEEIKRDITYTFEKQFQQIEKRLDGQKSSYEIIAEVKKHLSETYWKWIAVLIPIVFAACLDIFHQFYNIGINNEKMQNKLVEIQTELSNTSRRINPPTNGVAQ